MFCGFVGRWLDDTKSRNCVIDTKRIYPWLGKFWTVQLYGSIWFVDEFLVQVLCGFVYLIH